MSSENSGLEEKRLNSMFQKVKIDLEKCLNACKIFDCQCIVTLDNIRLEAVCGRQ
jgi:hypothetical protein